MTKVPGFIGFHADHLGVEAGFLIWDFSMISRFYTTTTAGGCANSEKA
jgi:hypothetical protein